ncbi:MAG: BatD family protein [Bacteroidales bacterium]|nr:BatD family protein [Bacteroidales bacterium]
MLTLLSMILALAGSAQHSFKLDAPGVVALDESFRIVFTATGECSDFTPPNLGDFEVLAGPSTSRMSSTQIINGKKTESFQISYTYILQPKSTGKFTISSASVLIDGKRYSSSPAPIEVIKGDNASASDSRQASVPSADDIFMRMTVSKSRVVKGENLVVTLKIYTRIPIAGFENVKFPSFNGFWSQEIETPSNIEFVRESVNGKIYNAALLRRYMLLPQQTGTLTIEPSEMICQVQVRSQNSAPRSIFDDFFDNYQTIRKRVTAPAVNVTVNPLPAGAPASFSGGVGSFTMDTRLSRDTLDANEAVSLIVTINGSGNINLIEAPKIEFPPDFEVYDTKITDKSSKGGNGASGSKEFEYPLIPRGAGRFTLPPVLFSYYDITKKKYVLLSSKELTLRVGKGTESISDRASLPAGVNKQAVRSLGTDVRFIKRGSPSFSKAGRFMIASPLFYTIIVLIAGIYFVSARFLSKRIEREKNIAFVKNRRANKVARARLKKAENLLGQNLIAPYYQELHRAILGYCSDKLNLSLADLSRENIAGLLKGKAVKEELINELLELIDACEYARYAPDPGGSEMENNYQKAIKLISELEG